MPYVKLYEDTQYDLRVFAVSETEFREALDDDAPESVITFKMKRLSRGDKTTIQDNLMDADGKMRIGTITKIAIQKAVKGWEGIADADGKPVSFSLHALDRLPDSLLDLIDNHIAAVNELGTKQEKN